MGKVMPAIDPNHPGHAKGFDPFCDRPSRTVRNMLSEMLGDCLAHGEIFPGDPPESLQHYSQAPYRDFIRDRIARYRKATREALEASDSLLARTAVLWRHGLYFEAHEVLESQWLASSGDQREGLKGLIQAAGVYVHWEAGHHAAAAGLARKAIDRLRRFGDAIGDQQAIDIKALLEDLLQLTGSTGGADA